MIKILKDFLYRKGYKINKINKNSLLNDNPFLGVQSKIGSSPIIFDVGANQGQTILKIKSLFPDSNLHSFEPSKICFKELSQKFENNEKLILNNLAVGAERGVLEFNEYSWSALNSFLKRAYSKSGIIDSYFVDIITVDDYCRKNNIRYINLLKTDTEGFELNVLKGASKMMSKNKVQFVFVYLKLFFEGFHPFCVLSPLWRIEKLKIIGGFDEKLAVAEDPDLHIRAFLQGFKSLTKTSIEYDSLYRINSIAKIEDKENKVLIEKCNNSLYIIFKKFLKNHKSSIQLYCLKYFEDELLFKGSSKDINRFYLLYIRYNLFNLKQFFLIPVLLGYKILRLESINGLGFYSLKKYLF